MQALVIMCHVRKAQKLPQARVSRATKPLQEALSRWLDIIANASLQLGQDEPPCNPPPRRLKSWPSNVSLDSQGWAKPPDTKKQRKEV